MGERKFTFLELHLDGDTQFGPRTLDALPLPETVTGSEAASSPEEKPDTETEPEEETDESASKAIGAVIALAVLVVAGVAVRKFRGGDDETEEQHEQEPDVIVN
ncbi:hypothetical protein [Natronobacterium gregoryi]|uniref:Uncharacterized protein n=2 Tax=Natronobacterium gregoryi TaxID=44930 RepID=L0AIJ1_NATGS|nr:hypothetical protein [Natronobacterium gregoryi]AFZ73259.1 hypothetical protein Natgr_2076 [Natronobacterium gregoryi SP2]ELY71282.1 hypothetical protein C490_05107 [Natronobacterium gregoryi SP2]PLK21665.1 hypothetical protein CYV19_03660 [Natronobacterium gregoryi SP2]SFI57308.1 hypothetical protein SAMN05443661_1025 [Natronobacterium gregoryi]